MPRGAGQEAHRGPLSTAFSDPNEERLGGENYLSWQVAQAAHGVLRRKLTTLDHLQDLHLSLLARWFHKKPRLGEIFFRESTARSSASAARQDEASARRNSEWPYRRILRACSRLLAPPEAADHPSAE